MEINKEKQYEKEDDRLYIARYGIPPVGDEKAIWERIKADKELLEWAITLTKDKFGENYIVKGLAICKAILVDYGTVDKEIYEKLVKLVYSNEQIARIILRGQESSGFSYLLMTLWNPNLKLTPRQKAFAANEALGMSGAIRSENDKKNLSRELDIKGITDKQTTYIDFGEKAHECGSFDLRYWILRNSNWSIEEKRTLIGYFWTDDEVYSEVLEDWEWAIVNSYVNNRDNTTNCFSKDKMYEYTYEQLLRYYGDKETTDRIWEEIEFCRLMHQLRPPHYEVEEIPRTFEKQRKAPTSKA